MFIQDATHAIVMAIIVILLFALVIGGACLLAKHYELIEVETYTVGCEISQLAYAEEQVSKTRTEPAYKMGVRNDEFATTLVITNEQFARYTVGEIVEVEVTVWERNNNGEISYTYKLIG